MYAISTGVICNGGTPWRTPLAAATVCAIFSVCVLGLLIEALRLLHQPAGLENVKAYVYLTDY